MYNYCKLRRYMSSDHGALWLSSLLHFYEMTQYSSQVSHVLEAASQTIR